MKGLPIDIDTQVNLMEIDRREYDVSVSRYRYRKGSLL